MAFFDPSAIGNLGRRVNYGSTIGHNDMFTWQNFRLLPTAIVNLAEATVKINLGHVYTELHEYTPSFPNKVLYYQPSNKREQVREILKLPLQMNHTVSYSNAAKLKGSLIIS